MEENIQTQEVKKEVVAQVHGFNVEGLRVLMAERNIKGVDMCRDIKMPRSQLAAYRNGRPVSMGNLHRIAGYFNLTVDELVAYNAKLKKNGGNWE